MAAPMAAFAGLQLRHGNGRALGGHEGRHAQEGVVVAHGLVRRAVGEPDALDAGGETQGARERDGV